MKGPAFATLLWIAWVGSPPAQEQPQPDLVVRARLSNTGTAAADCGYLGFAVVMRYEVIEVLTGHSGSSVLYAVHGCPEMPRSMYGGAAAGTVARFRMGDVHRLYLRSILPQSRDMSVIDGFEAHKRVRCWVLRADKDREAGEAKMTKEPQNKEQSFRSRR